MKDETLRKTIANGAATPWVCLLSAAALWAWPDYQSQSNWIGFGVSVLLALLLQWVCNSLQILRVRSWLLSGSFLILLAVVPFLRQWQWNDASLFLFLLSQAALYCAYESDHPERAVFHAYLLLALASLIEPKLMWAGAVFLLVIPTYLRAATARSFVSIFLALAVVAMGMAIWCFWQGDIAFCTQYYSRLLAFNLPLLTSWTIPQIVNFAFVAVLLLVSSLHFAFTCFNDLIRPRMFYYIFWTMLIFFVAMFLTEPQAYTLWFRFILLEGIAFVAHYLVLGTGRTANWVLYFTIILTAMLAVFNLWTPLLNF